MLGGVLLFLGEFNFTNYLVRFVNLILKKGCSLNFPRDLSIVTIGAFFALEDRFALADSTSFVIVSNDGASAFALFLIRLTILRKLSLELFFLMAISFWSASSFNSLLALGFNISI
jgi:hypothetical protein